MDRELSPKQRRAPWLSVAAKLLLAGALIAVLVSAGLRFLRPSLDRSDIRIATVESGQLEATITGTGTVVPRLEQTISSPVSAEVRAVFVSLGERVERGQVLMQLDTTASSLELGNLDERLALKKAEIRSQELQLGDAIRQARSRRELLGIDLESREVRLGRFEQLAGSGAISDNELLEVQLNLERTRVELEQTEAEILSLEARREADLERLRLEYSILDKQRADQARRVEMSSVRAPIDGIVTDLFQDAGAAVVETQALATIAAEQSFSVEAALSDFYGPQLRPKQRVRVHSSTSEFGGHLARILSTGDSSQLMLFVELDDPAAPAFHLNLRVDIEIVTAEKANVLKLRRGPGLGGAGIAQVYVIEGDRAVRRPVRLGLSGTQDIEVVDGLNVGDRVVISDMSFYENMSEIRIY